MRTEARAGLHTILIDYPQWTELDVLGVVVVGKGKRVKGLEPTVVGKASFLTASNFVHGNLLELNNRLERLNKKAQNLGLIDQKNGSELWA
jgi:hypothetical protein